MWQSRPSSRRGSQQQVRSGLGALPTQPQAPHGHPLADRSLLPALPSPLQLLLDPRLTLLTLQSGPGLAQRLPHLLPQLPGQLSAQPGRPKAAQPRALWACHLCSSQQGRRQAQAACPAFLVRLGVKKLKQTYPMLGCSRLGSRADHFAHTWHACFVRCLVCMHPVIEAAVKAVPMALETFQEAEQVNEVSLY